MRKGNKTLLLMIKIKKIKAREKKMMSIYKLIVVTQKMMKGREKRSVINFLMILMIKLKTNQISERWLKS